MATSATSIKRALFPPVFFPTQLLNSAKNTLHQKLIAFFKKLNKTDEPSSCVWMGMTLRENQKKKINVNSFATVLIHAVKNSLILWFVKNAEYLKNPKYTNWIRESFAILLAI